MPSGRLSQISFVGLFAAALCAATFPTSLGGCGGSSYLGAPESPLQIVDGSADATDAPSSDARVDQSVEAAVEASAEAARDATGDAPDAPSASSEAGGQDALSDSPALETSLLGDSPMDANGLLDAGFDAETDVSTCTAGGPCINPANGLKGICTGPNTSCWPCFGGSAGNAACVAAYGTGYVCDGTACTQGDCATAGDCDALPQTAGQLCVSLKCAPCQNDVQCLSDFYYRSLHFASGGVMCNVATGRCISAGCNQASTSCGTLPNTNGNAADFCCYNGCHPGNCCGDTDCPSHQVCSVYSCTSACVSPANNTYFVDPLQGSDDASSTGASRCALRSLTRALALIAAAGGDGTIQIVNDQSAPTLSAASGETFPIVLSSNVLIQPNDTTQNIPTIEVAAGKVGFELDDAGATLSYLTIDGQSGQADTGIAVYGGPNGNTANIDHITVQHMRSAGIVAGTAPGKAAGGVLAIGSGVVARGNGAAGSPGVGLRLYAQGNATVNGGSGVDHSSFSANTQHGIVVTDEAFLSVNGNSIDPTNPGTNDVDADGNGVAGLWISQNPATVAATSLNSVTGLHASSNAVGGQVTAGSYLQMRGNYVAQNTQTGMMVTSYAGGGDAGSGFVDDLSTMDLGRRIGPDYGMNVFVASGSTANGICLQVGASARTLLAAGNLFGSIDCSMAAGGTLRRSATCSGNVDVGGLSPGDVTTLDVSNCH